MPKSDFSENLRLLCSLEKSVSDVCRAVSINRQQFNKYLNGNSKPSANNLHRICTYFRVETFELYLPKAEFAERRHVDRTGQRLRGKHRTNHVLKQAFPGNRRGLSRYLGYYLSHFHSFSWKGYILRSLVCIYEQDGMVHTRTLERSRDPGDGSLFLSKYDGYVSLMGNRIFVVEFQSLAQDAVVETILHPAARTELSTLRGVTFGLSSKQRNPYVSRTVWKFLGQTVDLRAAVGSVGLVPIRSPDMDQNVRQILGDHPFPNELLRDDLELQEQD